jgi:hypothetical protein
MRNWNWIYFRSSGELRLDDWRIERTFWRHNLYLAYDDYLKFADPPWIKIAFLPESPPQWSEKQIIWPWICDWHSALEGETFENGPKLSLKGVKVSKTASPEKVLSRLGWISSNLIRVVRRCFKFQYRALLQDYSCTFFTHRSLTSNVSLSWSLQNCILLWQTALLSKLSIQFDPFSQTVLSR